MNRSNYLTHWIKKLQVLARGFSKTVWVAAFLTSWIGCTEAPVTYSYKVIESYPHDPNAFTQGLVFEGDVFYEGTGYRGRSSLRRVDLNTGNVVQHVDLEKQFFGEGIAVQEERIIQLTWKSQTGFIYHKETFERLGQFQYRTEGWGITYDGKRLIMSDGTSKLQFLDPATFDSIGSIDVFDHKGPVARLNELEYVKGEIYANVWLTDRVARISPETGRVTGWIELGGLLSPQERTSPDQVLNGIAYDSERDRLFVTGKLWPKIFEIELIRKDRLRQE